jgi:hypothetical protein
MTKEAIIAEIRKHSKEEQQEIIEAIWESNEEDYELSPEDIAVVEARFKHAKEHPETVMNEEQFWSNVKSLTNR